MQNFMGICKSLPSAFSIMLPSYCLHPEAFEIWGEINNNSLTEEIYSFIVFYFCFFTFIKIFKGVSQVTSCDRMTGA